MPQDININDYGYSPDQSIEINAIMFMDLLQLLGKVKDQEYLNVMLARVPKSIKKGNVEWKEATPQQFFGQESQPAYTFLGTKALDLEYVFQNIHYANIENGIAKHKEELSAKFEKLNKEHGQEPTTDSAPDDVPQQAVEQDQS